MASKKLHEPESQPSGASIPADASEWLQKFVAAFERSFVEESTGLLLTGDISDLQDVTVCAMVHTLLDSGMTSASLLERIGVNLSERDGKRTDWNPTLNQRRLVLIDKQIQKSNTNAEAAELARLTAIMREHTDTELDLPMEGARTLHRRHLDVELRNQQP